jgi:hypothetical protein
MGDWAYWANNPAGLARMVVPDIYGGHPELIPPNIFELRLTDGKSAAVDALYDRLKARCLHYDLEPPAAKPALGMIPWQPVRPPRDLFDGGRGTCLDLALAFCGMCENAWLRPFLALLTFADGRRHALVVVGAHDRDDPKDPVNKQQWKDQGTWQASSWSELAGRLPSGWVAVDPAMATRWVDDAGAARPVDFDQARQSALDTLARANHVTLLDIVYLHNNGPGTLAAEPLSASSESELSAAVRTRHRDQLTEAGLRLPDRWGLGELTRLTHEQRQRMPGSSSAGDLLEALCTAVAAKPVLARIGGPDIGGRKLQDLYHRHVGGWPGVSDSDELLVLAASAGIAQRRGPRAQEPLTPLAQFLLGVAGYWRAPAVASLADPELRFLADWITGPLELKRADADAYLARNVDFRTWAIIELDGDDRTMTWPERVVVDSVDDHGRPGESFNITCAERSQAGLADALRSAITRLGGIDAGLRVDLLMPAPLLTAGVEHYEVVDVFGDDEPIIKDLEPRLGWWRHWRKGGLRDQLLKRFALQDWTLAPEVIPRDTCDDRNRFKDWLQSCEARTAYPPYFCGIGSPDPDHDPLRALLRQGYGFFAWFGRDEDEAMAEHAASLAGPVDPAARRNALPDLLSRQLAGHQATVIWSDPEGRPDFPPPVPRPGGQNRGGGR